MHVKFGDFEWNTQSLFVTKANNTEQNHEIELDKAILKSKYWRARAKLTKFTIVAKPPKRDRLVSPNILLLLNILLTVDTAS